MSSLIEIEKGLYSSSHFVNNQSKKVARNLKDYLIKATSNQNLEGMTDEQLQQNLEDVKEAMKRNHDNAQHQQMLRGIFTGYQTEINNRKTKSNNEPTTKN
jgi:uncharacterized membrane-anchored protein